MGYAQVTKKVASIQQSSTGPIQWLRDFAKAVRENDITTGRSLCDMNIRSFGTVCWRSENLDMLVRDQWEHIWPNTHGFDFEYDTVQVISSNDTATLLTTWTSNGINADGHSFPRQGRATIVLQRDGDIWKCVHTHFSMDPRG